MVIHSGKPIVQIGRELGVKRSQSACLWGTVAWLIACSLLTPPRPYIPRCHPINPFPLLAQQPSHQAAGFKTVIDPPTWLSEEERRREGVPHRVAPLSFRSACAIGRVRFFLTVRPGKEELYDRIAIGGIERLRMMAIELASTEGFTRSRADVSLRPW